MDRDLEERVRENPSTRLFAPLADAYRRKGRIEEAIEILVQGLAYHPLYISARILLARCYEDMGEWQRARNEWKAVLDLDDRSLVALKAMGEIDRLLGDLDRSQVWFRRYLDEFPDDDAVRERLAQIEHESGPSGEPESEAEKELVPKTFHLDLEPPEYSDGYEPGMGEDSTSEEGISVAGECEEEDSVETITLAEIYAQQGFYERAIDIYTRILARETENEQIVRRIDELSGKLGRKTELVTRSVEESEEEILDESSPSPVEKGEGDAKEEDTGPEEGDFDREIDGPIEVVDINRANVLQLEAIPGVGPVIAQKIVVERERNGPFASPEELDRVSSLGERLIERILPYLKFEESSSAGETTPLETTSREATHPVDEGAEGTLSGEEIFEENVDSDQEQGREDVESEFEDFRRWLKNLRK